jgi:DNA polymerase-3 subunit epsilon
MSSVSKKSSNSDLANYDSSLLTSTRVMFSLETSSEFSQSQVNPFGSCRTVACMLFRAQRQKSYSQRTYYRASFFAKPGEIGKLFAYASFASEIEIDSNFAIVDIETSGLRAQTSHIIEIAVLVTSPLGERISQFETLVQPPDGQVGRSDIHKIEQRDVVNAPTFSEIAGDILSSLEGCVIVAHNAKFEEEFLFNEFRRIGIDVPHIPAIDTMWLAQMELDLRNYKLATVAQHFGHEVERAHTAMGDVEAIGKFLPALLGSVPPLKYPNGLSKLPPIPSNAKAKTR